MTLKKDSKDRKQSEDEHLEMSFFDISTKDQFYLNSVLCLTKDVMITMKEVKSNHSKDSQFFNLR
jgi:hypothetical protein